MAGCLATLRELKRQGNALQQGLTDRTAAFAKTLNDYFIEEQIEMRVVHFASTFSFRFPGNLEILYYHLIEKGVYIWEWRACFLSTAHTDADLAFVIEVIKEAVQEMRDGGFLPPKPPGSAKSVARALHHSTASVTSSTQSATDSSPAARSTAQTGLSFGLYFFGNYDAAFSANKYELLMQGCRYADENGFASVWLPERHFDKFGGFSPNPSVLAAALARETSRIALRAGSVVMPLHHPLRVAEEWSLVDNLSDGRVGIAFASGWHPNDFALAPANYSNNREVTFAGVETVRQLWRGESVEFEAGDQQTPSLSIYPRPKQAELPAWLTVVGNPETYRKAGEMGLGILTNLLGQSLEDLEANIQVYKEALKNHGHGDETPRITVLVHTFMQADAAQAIETARQPMCDYLLSSLSLFQKMAQSLPPNLRDIETASEADKAYIVAKAYERYVAERALIGSPQTCQPMVQRLQAMGITEIACFVDFGVAAADVLQSLPVVKSLLENNQTVVPAPSTSHRLSEAQRQLWMIAQLNGDGRQAYMDPGHARIKGPLDVESLRQALTVLVSRHESLRTTIDQDGVWQHVHPAHDMALPLVDLSQQSDPAQAAQDWIAEQMQQPVDLINGPLFSPYLLRLDQTHHVLSLFAHHIISDGPSMGVMIHEVMALLEGTEPHDLPEALQYRAFVQWQADQRQTPRMQAHEQYWLNQFAAIPPDLILPLDHARPPVQTWAGNRLRLTCPKQTSVAVGEIAAKHGCTPYMVLLGAYSVLLHRLTQQSDVVIGAAYAGRAMPGSQTMVGYGVHLLPILSSCGAGTSFGEHLDQIKETLLQAYAHQDYPFAWLMNQLPLKRDPSRPPLVATIFNHEKLPAHQSVGDMKISPYFGPTSYARVDLTLTVNQVGPDMFIEADFNTALFNGATIERLLRTYLQVLDQMQHSAEQPIARAPLLSPADQAFALIDFNAVPQAQTDVALHRLIEQQVQTQPDALAVRVYEDDTRSLSFKQLNERANQLARHLLAQGTGPDQRVGVCLGRTPDLLIALLACLKSGAAYVPMDPDYPTPRLQYLIGDAKLSALVTTQAIVDQTALTCDTLVLLDQQRGEIERHARENLDNTHLPEQLAYVIYTSGSTGHPKGTMVCHAGLSNYVQWAVDAYDADQGDGSPVLGSIGFDATITSLFVPLAAGKPTVLMPQGPALEALEALSKTQDQYSFIKITPAHLEILNSLRQQQARPNRQLAKYLVLGGEALPGAYLDPWFDQSITRGVNEYGPTETVVGCCTFTAHDPCAGAVPIGRPIAGTRLYVLDEYLNPVLPGIPGELYIGGAGVARGYLNRPAQTASVFVPDPFGGEQAPAGARLYKTGDLVRSQSDGTLVFLGRIDSQIKLHGFRIEPGEIEAALTDLPQVREALVIKHQPADGQAMLIGYVTTTTATIASTQAEAERRGDALIEQLREQLPAHQIPGRILILKQMPLTTHGKIDRSKLPTPGKITTPRKQAVTQTPKAPNQDLEQAIDAVWCDVLNRTNIGTEDNFFDLGGNSLLLLEVHRRLQDHLPAGCQVIDLFRYPTMAALASFVREQNGLGGTVTQPIVNQTDARVARQLAARKRQTVRQPVPQRRARPSAA
jgi:natural product biosynthesis luciferase-like monooxygenase protein/amino acid adenylation domain-containing protein